jgi:hypothetical protein
MPGKPTAFPGPEQATDHIPSEILEHLADVFAATSTAVNAAQAPDVSDPPDSVLVGVDPKATIDFPDQALDAFSTHANLPAHVTDWFI